MNIWIKVQRTEEFYRKVVPLVNIGVLVKYPMGKGGVVLNQMNVTERDSDANNEAKKRDILSKLLANMTAD